MLEKLIKKIKNSQNFLITSHISLEGDALGSELATYLALKKLNKKVIIYNNDITPFIYKFLPSSIVIKNELKEDRFDVALVLDCSDISRTGKVKDYLDRVKYIINIDHHISNTHFGDLNWIDSKASSTSEILYKLFERLKVIDKKIATCLYVGIISDTGNCTYANTTINTYKVLADLMYYGISPTKIYQNIHSLCNEKDLKFIGRILSSLEFDSKRKIYWIKINKWIDKDYDITEIIFSIMKLLRDGEVFILFKKIGKNKVRVNFRSRSKVDVNKIAKFFGGGGHKKASGTTVDGSLELVVKKVISFVRRYTNGLK